MTYVAVLKNGAQIAEAETLDQVYNIAISQGYRADQFTIIQVKVGMRV